VCEKKEKENYDYEKNFFLHFCKMRFSAIRYLGDWLCLGIPLFFIVYGEIADPIKRHVDYDSIDILHGFPHLPHTISIELLIGGVLLGNAIVSVLLSRLNLHDLHHSMLGLISGILVTEAFSNMIKISVGRYRPNFKESCQMVFSQVRECIESNDRRTRDGRLSFPSGHTAVAFCFGVFQTCYLAGKLKIFVPNESHKIPLLFKALFTIHPLIFSSWVMVTRLQDYHHSFEDVVAGMLLGSFFGCFAYYLYFNPLSSKDSDSPKFHNDSETTKID
jgi:diacylglycerol diphosphate phosphatase/phosphatidate phosphatase